MPQRTKVVGARAPIIWLLIVIAVLVVAVLAVVVLVIYPQFQKEQNVEQHYQAGIVFQKVEDWDKALAEFEQAIRIDATYKDARTRLAEVKAKQKEATDMAHSVAATATAEALEAHYQKGLGYMNIERWEEAKAELEQVFEVDPNYKEVQTKLSEVEGKLAEIRALTPTTAPDTPIPLVIVPANIAPEGRVEVSSVFPEQGGQCYQGSRAIDGVVSGYPVAPCNEWATNGEKAGAWLKITFTTPRHINQVVLYDRPNLYDHILEGTLSFSDGTTLRTGALPNDGSARKFVFKPKIVQWIQFTVDRADGPNTGLAEIEVYGW